MLRFNYALRQIFYDENELCFVKLKQSHYRRGKNSCPIQIFGEVVALTNKRPILIVSKRKMQIETKVMKTY